MDFGEWTKALPNEETIEIGSIVLYVLHNFDRLNIDLDRAGVQCVIAGHTHRPQLYKKNGISFLNPGSASYPKFGQPASGGLIQIENDAFITKLIKL